MLAKGEMRMEEDRIYSFKNGSKIQAIPTNDPIRGKRRYLPLLENGYVFNEIQEKVHELSINNIGKVDFKKLSISDFDNNIPKTFKFKYGNTLVDFENRKAVEEIVSKWAGVELIDCNGNYKTASKLIFDCVGSCKSIVSEFMSDASKINKEEDGMSVNIGKGTEGNITWELNGGGRFIEIKVSNGFLTETETYECVYEPIFGYDGYDVNSINERLDEMIKAMKEK